MNKFDMYAESSTSQQVGINVEFNNESPHKTIEDSITDLVQGLNEQRYIPVSLDGGIAEPQEPELKKYLAITSCTSCYVQYNPSESTRHILYAKDAEDVLTQVLGILDEEDGFAEYEAKNKDGRIIAGHRTQIAREQLLRDYLGRLEEDLCELIVDTDFNVIFEY